jgi:hypothetical protein
MLETLDFSIAEQVVAGHKKRANIVRNTKNAGSRNFFSYLMLYVS